MLTTVHENTQEWKLSQHSDVVKLSILTPNQDTPEGAQHLREEIKDVLAARYSGRGARTVPQEIAISYLPPGRGPSGVRQQETTQEASTADADLMEPITPRFTLDDYICDSSFRATLRDGLFYANRYRQIRARMKARCVGRSLLLNFFGKSGTGKTMVAEAFANDLGKKLYVLNYANVESSLLGKTPKNISAAFRSIPADESVVVLDEADSFVSKRISELSQGAEYALNTARAQIITEIDRFDGIIILSTNLFRSYDDAIRRRIKFNLLFQPGTEDALVSMYKQFLPHSSVAKDVSLRAIAEISRGLSGGDVYTICEIVVMKSLQREAEGQGPCSETEFRRIIRSYKKKDERSENFVSRDDELEAVLRSQEQGEVCDE